MHILWISIVEHVSELSLVTTNRRRKHLGCPRASQQIWKLYWYKAHNSTWKSAMPAWAEYYSQRQIFSYEFCFLIASKIENVRWWENETHAPQIFRSLDVFSYTHTHTHKRFGEIVTAVAYGQVLFSYLSWTHNLCSAVGPFRPEESVSPNPSTSYFLGLV